MSAIVKDISRIRMINDAQSIRKHLRNAEAKSDALLEGTAELMQQMLAARRNPAVAPHTGQHAIMRLIRAQQSIVAGSNELFRVHDELVKVAKTSMMLDQDGSTPPSGISDADAVDFVSEAVAA